MSSCGGGGGGALPSVSSREKDKLDLSRNLNYPPFSLRKTSIEVATLADFYV